MRPPCENKKCQKWQLASLLIGVTTLGFPFLAFLLKKSGKWPLIVYTVLVFFLASSLVITGKKHITHEKKPIKDDWED